MKKSRLYDYYCWHRLRGREATRAQAELYLAVSGRGRRFFRRPVLSATLRVAIFACDE